MTEKGQGGGDLVETFDLHEITSLPKFRAPKSSESDGGGGSGGGGVGDDSNEDGDGYEDDDDGGGGKSGSDGDGGCGGGVYGDERRRQRQKRQRRRQRGQWQSTAMTMMGKRAMSLIMMALPKTTMGILMARPKISKVVLPLFCSKILISR